MFLLKLSSEKKNVGIYPQVIEFANDHHVTELIDLRNIPFTNAESAVKLRPIQLRKGAKRTDFLSVVMAGFPDQLICSKKIIEIFSRYRGQPHTTSELEVRHKGDVLTYYLVNFLGDVSVNPVDFSKSRAYYAGGERAGDEIADVSWERFRTNRYLRMINLPIKDQVLQSYSYFGFPIFPKFILADDLAEDLIAANVTGVRFIYFTETADIRTELR